jgi:hypothetical protein
MKTAKNNQTANRFEVVEVKTRRNGSTVYYWEVRDAFDDRLCGFGDHHFARRLAAKLEAESIADRDAA